MSPVAQFWQNARKRKWRIVAGIGGLTLALALIGGIVLAIKWPFSERELTQSIQEIVPGTVQMEKFRSTILPYPGCVAETVSVHGSAGDSADQTSVTVQRIVIRARYQDLIFRPGYLARIVLHGLQIHIPRPGSGASPDKGLAQNASKTSTSKTRVGEIVADGTVLEIARGGGKKPLEFDIHSLRLGSVSRVSAMSYSVSMTNPLPPGEIVSSGHIGPFNGQDIGKTPVSGSYRFRNADLSVLTGIEGMLSSKDDFGGELDQIRVHGGVEVEKFELKGTDHPVQLHASYNAAVDALNGDVFLQEVRTTFLQTTVVASGRVAGQPGRTGRVASLNVAVQEGRIQDVLGLFVTGQKPPMSGQTSFRADILIPSSGRGFLKSVRLDGDFTIDEGRFTSPQRQLSVDTMSARASGEKPDGNSDPGYAPSELTGTVRLRNGVATFANARFAIPGASARLDGTYDLISERIDLHGLLRTEAELSQDTGGAKSVLLKPFNPLFKRKHAGARVAVSITGTYSSPRFGVDLNPGTRKSPEKLSAE